MGDITKILAAVQEGDSQAADQLLPLVYEELRKLAVVRMANEKPGLGIDFNEALAAKFPIPAGPPMSPVEAPTAAPPMTPSAVPAPAFPLRLVPCCNPARSAFSPQTAASRSPCSFP